MDQKAVDQIRTIARFHNRRLDFHPCYQGWSPESIRGRPPSYYRPPFQGFQLGPRTSALGIFASIPTFVISVVKSNTLQLWGLAPRRVAAPLATCHSQPRRTAPRIPPALRAGTSQRNVPTSRGFSRSSREILPFSFFLFPF
jgi:hypothetical protein